MQVLVACSLGDGGCVPPGEAPWGRTPGTPTMVKSKHPDLNNPAAPLPREPRKAAEMSSPLIHSPRVCRTGLGRRVGPGKHRQRADYRGRTGWGREAAGQLQSDVVITTLSHLLLPLPAGPSLRRTSGLILGWLLRPLAVPIHPNLPKASLNPLKDKGHGSKLC